MRPRARPRSLRLQLLVGTLAWVLLAVGLAGWGLRALFGEHVREQLRTQLVLQLDQLSAALEWEPGKGVRLEAVALDARLSQPLSGLYWQVDRLGAAAQAGLLRSRSLWDQTLALPPLPEGYPTRGHRMLELTDAQGHGLLAVARTLELPDEQAPRLRLVVAADEKVIAEPIGRFTRLLLIALATLGAGLLGAVALQLQIASRPLARMRHSLAAVRGGGAARIEGRFPQELQPLVQEFNHVLAANAEMVQRARTQAGNLAHAVHTPLSVLANASAGAEGPLAALVRDQVQIARRQVDYHLARARAAAAARATGLRTPVLPPLQALLRTMQRLHVDRELVFELAPGAEDLAFRGEEQDLYELLGNLLDNAGKWARTRVLVDVRGEGEQLAVTVDDDGPGIPVEQRERMFERGVQLDERRAGSGLGLDIVRTLAEPYGGGVQVLEAPLGGARLRLRLPRAS